MQCFPLIDFTWAGRPCIFGDLFFIILFIRPRKWNHPWSINYRKISHRPTHFIVLWAQELLTLPQTISSVSHTIIYLWRATSISTIRCHQLPRDERDFSTIFSNFQTLLAAFFFHNRYTLTNLATFLEKTLAVIHLDDVASTGPGRERKC